VSSEPKWRSAKKIQIAAAAVRRIQMGTNQVTRARHTVLKIRSTDDIIVHRKQHRWPLAGEATERVESEWKLGARSFEDSSELGPWLLYRNYKSKIEAALNSKNSRTEAREK